jgi:hypothetical protein
MAAFFGPNAPPPQSAAAADVDAMTQHLAAPGAGGQNPELPLIHAKVEVKGLQTMMDAYVYVYFVVCN